MNLDQKVGNGWVWLNLACFGYQLSRSIDGICVEDCMGYKRGKDMGINDHS